MKLKILYELWIKKGSFQSLHGGDYQNSLHYQNGSSSQQTAAVSHSSPSAAHHHQQQSHYNTAQQQQQQYRQHLNSVTSSDSISGNSVVGGNGNARSRVNSDSTSKYNTNSSNSAKSSKNNTSNNNNNNPPLSSEKKCANANGANQHNNGSSVNSNRNLSNNLNSVHPNSSSHNNLSSNNNNSSNSGHIRQRHIIELNRQVSELNNKNIEFNRQLSAPVENQNSCNSVYNLYSNNILNNQYHSGSPNTNSLNRTKKKRSFKLNGRWVAVDVCLYVLERGKKIISVYKWWYQCHTVWEIQFIFLFSIIVMQTFVLSYFYYVMQIHYSDEKEIDELFFLLLACETI